MELNIDLELKRLVGLPLTKATRIDGVQYLHFGIASITTSSGLILDVGEYTLSLSCFWKIIKDGAILIDFNDVFISRSTALTEDFDWKVPGSTRRDQKLKDLINSETLVVSETACDASNNLRVTFSNGMVLEVLPQEADSPADYWRFFSNTDHNFSLMAGSGPADLLDSNA